MKVKVKVNSVLIESETESGFFSIYTFTPEPSKGFNHNVNCSKRPSNLHPESIYRHFVVEQFVSKHLVMDIW